MRPTWLILSRTLAPGKHSVSMVDWKYSGIFLVNLDHRAHLPATKFRDSGPGLRSNRTIRRLDLFHHAQSKARCNLAKASPLLRGPPELVPGTAAPGFRLCMMKEIEPPNPSIRP